MNATTSFTISHSPPFQISSSLHRPRKNSNKPSYSSPDQQFNLVIDIENIKNKASTSLKTFFSTTKTKLNRYIYSGTEALEDFKTLVTVDNNRRVIISCRRSSIWFLANSLLWGFVIVLVFRAFVGKLGFWRYYHGAYGGNGGFVSRRDRSLGGREVVVEKMRFEEIEGKKNKNGGFNCNPLSLSREMMSMVHDVEVGRSRKRVSTGEELPLWWPDFVPSSAAVSPMKNNQEFQKEADRLIQAIMNSRMCGKDITEDDILQFRRITKASGAKVHIDTANVRDSFYRASVDFVLNTCSSSASSSSVGQIEGEDARQFVAGLADSIGLQKYRAARIVSAAVAARTRSLFLQAWALEMQGKRAEALTELSKICLIHEIFPPDESSPEMEMVAQGLEKHLRIDQRKLLLNLLVGRCSSASTSRSAAEALGLMNKPWAVEDYTRRVRP